MGYILPILGAVGTVFALLYGYARYLVGRPRYCTSKASMMGKTVIITGGNSGIGKETAIDLAKRGARVILACRNPEKANAAVKEIREICGHEQVVYRHLNLADFDSVRTFAEQTIEAEERLDVLINNGGTGVTANSLHPGAIMTPIWNDGLTHSYPLWITKLVIPVIRSVLWDSWSGAQTTIYCAVDETLEQVSGKYFHNCHIEQESNYARDEVMAKQLWDVSLELCGLKD